MIEISDAKIDEVVAKHASHLGENAEEQKLLSKTTRATLNSLLELLEINAPTALTHSTQAQGNQPNGRFKLTFAEWALRYNLKTHFDRVLAIMEYLYDTKGQSVFSTQDIAMMYEKARWKKPANLADVFAKGAERHLFAEDGEDESGKKLWRMTQTGYDHLNEITMEVTA